MPVGELIASRLPWTLLLTVPSLVLATAVTVVAGTEAAWRRGSLLDYALILGFTLVRTVPVFFLGVLAVLVFAVHLRLFPLSGAVTPFRIWASPLAQALDILHHWALPAAVLTVESVGARFLLMRNSVTLVLAEPYVQTARAKGLGELAIRYRHAVPNAILPLFTTFSAQLGMAVAGTVFVETIFAYPGMGLLLFQAVSARDYPVLEAGFLILSAGVLLGNLLADLAYGCLDPRVRRP
ncbi:MAG: ABC transporter permease [Chloroflexota bacterium]